MADKKNKITQASMLLFEWRLEHVDGQVKVDKLQIRADNAFDRGIHLPRDWAELCAPLPEVATCQRFTITAAREAAKDATQQAKRKLEDACSSVLCRCPLLHVCFPCLLAVSY